jgi:hypothetical protein
MGTPTYYQPSLSPSQQTVIIQQQQQQQPSFLSRTPDALGQTVSTGVRR